MLPRIIEIQRAYDALCLEVAGCRVCGRMAGSARVLSRAAGRVDAPVMFVGEAPGRLGADDSEIPFHGDKAGHNFEELLDSIDLSRADIFVTNAVLCNPKDAKGNNSPPNNAEIENCSSFLRRQIDLVSPRIVVSLGATALNALGRIEGHGLTLNQAVRSSVQWYGRILVPLYHPGQRAMIRRNMELQRTDYSFVREQLDAIRVDGLKSSQRHDVVSVRALAREIVGRTPSLSYFALHKLIYLFELDQLKRNGRRRTAAFFLRQKDGPYCVDINPQKLRQAGVAVTSSHGTAGPLVSLVQEVDLFGGAHANLGLASEVKREVEEFLVENRGLTNEQLKTKAYLSRPMRKILKDEKELKKMLHNLPIDLTAA